MAFALDLLAGEPPDSQLRLGGGTALAALWHHRLSTDIDLVCSNDVWERYFSMERKIALVEELRYRRANGAPVTRPARSINMIGWNMASGPVSIVRSRLEDSANLWSDHNVEGTGVRLATTESILRGKLHGRLVTTGTGYARDGYDVAVALLEDADTTKHLLETNSEVLPLMRKHVGSRIGPPLISPAYPRIAGDPWGAAMDILDQGLTLDDFERVERDDRSRHHDT